MTREYLDRPVDSRMVRLIEEHVRGADSVIDVACGSGLYGPTLRRVAGTVCAIDFDPVLCEAARATGAYERVVCAGAETLPQHFGPVDAIFCSEFLEHVRNDDLRTVLRGLEEVATRTMVITVPNPRSPHFATDPTHILRYDVRSFLRILNESTRFTYELLPLGFSDLNLRKLHFRVLNLVSSRVALASPTVLYVGRRR